MSTISREGSGFSFENVERNKLLTRRDVKAPTVRTTGTTLAGLVYKDGVILGADTRATAGSVVAEKNTEKLNYIAPNIYCAGSGTAADCSHVTELASSALALHALATGRQNRVITAETVLKNHLRRYQGYVSAGLILGGVDLTGPHLSTIFPHGSTDSQLYTTMGSGTLCAMTVLESGYRENMEKSEAMDLVARAIRSGIYNDLGSGSNVDLVVITKDGSEMIRTHELLMEKTYSRRHPQKFPPGTAHVLKERMIPLSELVVEDADAMDTS